MSQVQGWLQSQILMDFVFPDDLANKKPCCHAYVNVQTKGDLSSLTWIDSPLKYYQDDDQKSLCHVHYAALNFRDVMLATGRLPADAIPGDLATQDCILGMEVSGLDETGNKVMGLVPAKVSREYGYHLKGFRIVT